MRPPLPSPQLFQHHVGEVSYKVLRNSDFREVCLEVEGSTVLRFAATYGFRNIQVSFTAVLDGLVLLVASILCAWGPGTLMLVIMF